jgi:hypothetical protein
MVDSMGVYPHVLRLFGALVESFINYDFGMYERSYHHHHHH